jgi:hypothetical protein
MFPALAKENAVARCKLQTAHLQFTDLQMGCGTSSRIFDVDDAIPGQGRKALETFRSLGLTDSDIDKLYQVFKSFDVKSDNGIEISEFLLKLHLGSLIK